VKADRARSQYRSFGRNAGEAPILLTHKAIVDLSISHGDKHQPSEITDLMEKQRAQNMAFKGAV